jgi:hypothetical protein
MKQQAMSSNQNLVFPIDMLPYDLQHKILFHLPTDDAVQYTVVQKEWQLGINSWASGTPMDYTPHPQKPFYLMFNSEVACLATYAYNSNKDRWMYFEIMNSEQEKLVPSPEMPLCGQNPLYITASRGLVCFMDARRLDNIFVFNPILKDRVRVLPKAPGTISGYCAIAISADIRSRKYAVVMVTSQVGGIERADNLTIQLYESDTQSWANLHSESVDWYGGDTCAICKDVVYSMAYCSNETPPYHAIVAYNLSQRRQKQSLDRRKVSIPCAMTCVRLLNLNDKVILVGGIEQQGRRKVETIGIWEICGKEWKEITRVPHDVFGRLHKTINDGFVCSGCGTLIFIQAYTSRALLMYEFINDVWRFAPYPPIPLVKNNSDYFSGFCFEPRLDIVP